MAHMNRAVASLRIMGDDLDPEEVTALLCGSPSHTQKKGQPVHSTSDKPSWPANSGLWRKNAIETKPEDFDLQVRQMLNELTQDIGVWKALSTKYRMDVFCGWFMSSSNEGVEIKPETLFLLGQRGITLGIDIYAPE